ncbi:Transmembrane protein, partial [Sciurus carolinensis]|nr:Transmembrane protein [Sciurus carolinensis]
LVRLVPLLSGTHSSIPEDSLTYASMTLQSLGEKSNHLTANHSADLDPVVYAQIKVTSQ